MFEKLRAYCERQAHLTEEEYSLLETLYVPKKMKKGDFLLREGEVAKYGAFVVRGCLRSYTIDDKGREHILQFSPEDWWVGNLESYRTGKPSTYFVDAIEDSDVLLQGPIRIRDNDDKNSNPGKDVSPRHPKKWVREGQAYNFSSYQFCRRALSGLPG